MATRKRHLEVMAEIEGLLAKRRKLDSDLKGLQDEKGKLEDKIHREDSKLQVDAVIQFLTATKDRVFVLINVKRLDQDGIQRLNEVCGGGWKQDVDIGTTSVMRTNPFTGSATTDGWNVESGDFDLADEKTVQLIESKGWKIETKWFDVDDTDVNPMPFRDHNIEYEETGPNVKEAHSRVTFHRAALFCRLGMTPTWAKPVEMK